MKTYRTNRKQLNKLIDIVKLIDLAESAHIERELMMVKIKTTDRRVMKSEHGGYIPRQSY
jgi:acetolactate synthase small subunit